jgi:hypothetical protein
LILAGDGKLGNDMQHSVHQATLPSGY